MLLSFPLHWNSLVPCFASLPVGPRCQPVLRSPWGSEQNLKRSGPWGSDRAVATKSTEISGDGGRIKPGASPSSIQPSSAADLKVAAHPQFPAASGAGDANSRIRAPRWREMKSTPVRTFNECVMVGLGSLIYAGLQSLQCRRWAERDRLHRTPMTRAWRRKQPVVPGFFFTGVKASRWCRSSPRTRPLLRQSPVIATVPNS